MRAILALLLSCLLVSACGSGDPEVSYKPPYLPIKFQVGSDGVDVVGEQSIVTPLGAFSINAKYALTGKSRDEIYVVIENRKLGRDGTKWIYRVKAGTGSFTAVVDGRTTIQVKHDGVTIDVTDGSIKVIELAQVAPTSTDIDTSSFSAWWHTSVSKWDAGWESSFYKPFILARWAYDDSTINRGYGFGFVWFLLRLALSIVFAILDLLLTAIFLVAQLSYYLFDSTGRNIVWGVAVLAIAVPIVGFIWTIFTE